MGWSDTYVWGLQKRLREIKQQLRVAQANAWRAEQMIGAR